MYLLRLLGWPGLSPVTLPFWESFAELNGGRLLSSVTPARDGSLNVLESVAVYLI